MIGLVLVTHGRLAVEFRAALEHVVGAQTQIETVSIGPDDDIERRRQDILDAVAKVNDGSGVILLTDMFGGTPSNLAISVMEAGKVEVIAGVNLPMLIKLASVRGEKPLAEAHHRRAGRRPQVHQRRQPGAQRQMMEDDGSGRPLAATSTSSTSAACTPAPPPASSSAPSASTPRSRVSKDPTTVGGTSIMGLMMLAAGIGSTIRVTAEGRRPKPRSRRSRRWWPIGVRRGGVGLD